MHVGIDASRSAISRRTGTEAYSLQVTRALLRLATGDRYTLYFNQPPQPGLFPRLPNVEERRLPFPRLWTHLRLSLEMAASAPDVLFVPAHVVPLMHPHRCVVTLHDLGYRYYPQAHRPVQWWYLHLSTLWSAHAATLILADSQATRDDLIRHYGVSPDKIRVVYLGCDASLRRVEDPKRLAQMRQRLGVAEDYFLYLGTLQPRKNVPRLLQAFALARERHGLKHQLVLAGQPGYQAEAIDQQLHSLGLENAVRRTGYVPEEELAALLSGATALVFPSLYEGFGLPALEAMACGTPVIASNASSLSEVVGEAGYLLGPCDVEAWSEAMAEVAASEERRGALRELGLKRVERFTWERCALQTHAALVEAAARQRSY